MEEKEIRIPDCNLGSQKNIVEQQKEKEWKLVGIRTEIVLIFKREIPETELNQGNKTSIEVESATTETEQKIPEPIMVAPHTDDETKLDAMLGNFHAGGPS